MPFPLVRSVSWFAGFCRSLTTRWAREDKSKRGEQLVKDAWGLLAAVAASLVGAAAGELLVVGSIAARLYLLGLIVQYHRPLVDAWRGTPQARKAIQAEQLRPILEEYERQLAAYAAAEQEREWETRYGVPLVTFGPLSRESQKDVRMAMERLRAPFDQAGGSRTLSEFPRQTDYARAKGR